MAKKKFNIPTSEQKMAAEEQIAKLNKTVRYDTQDYTIGYLVSAFYPKKKLEEYNDEDISEAKKRKMRFFIPDYQRNSVWDANNRSMFIESILLGFPIPFLFFCQRADGNIEIVDGVQRIMTLHSFLENGFALAKLPKLSALTGFKFVDLSESTRRKFENRTLRIILLDDNTPEDVRQELFSRVNRGGKKINPAEFRRGTFPGKLTEFIEKCSKNKIFIDLCPLTKNKVERYTRFELVLRYFAFIDHYQECPKEVSPFLDDFLDENQNNFDEKKYNDEFIRMCLFVKKYFPLGFAKSKQSVPNVRFEAIAVGVSLALRENPALEVENIEWIDSDDFKSTTTSDASNNTKRLVERVEYVRDSLLGRPTSVRRNNG